jgi:sec-independent protein translocase protein TatB
MPDILFILVLALIIFGPKKLPEVMRQVAKFMAQFRVMRDDLKRQIEGEMLKIELEERQKPQTAVAPPPPPPAISAPSPAETTDSTSEANVPSAGQQSSIHH